MKKRTNVSIDEEVLQKAKDQGINISQKLNEALKETDLTEQYNKMGMPVEDFRKFLYTMMGRCDLCLRKNLKDVFVIEEGQTSFINKKVLFGKMPSDNPTSLVCYDCAKKNGFLPTLESPEEEEGIHITLLPEFIEGLIKLRAQTESKNMEESEKAFQTYKEMDKQYTSAPEKKVVT